MGSRARTKRQSPSPSPSPPRTPGSPKTSSEANSDEMQVVDEDSGEDSPILMEDYKEATSSQPRRDADPQPPKPAPAPTKYKLILPKPTPGSKKEKARASSPGETANQPKPQSRKHREEKDSNIPSSSKVSLPPAKHSKSGSNLVPPNQDMKSGVEGKGKESEKRAEPSKEKRKLEQNLSLFQPPPPQGPQESLPLPPPLSPQFPPPSIDAPTLAPTQPSTTADPKKRKPATGIKTPRVKRIKPEEKAVPGVTLVLLHIPSVGHAILGPTQGSQAITFLRQALESIIATALPVDSLTPPSDLAPPEMEEPTV